MSTKASVSSLLFAALISVLLLSVPTQAWWCTGHMAVAEIARRHLRPDVAKIVEKATAHLKSSGPFPKLHDFVQSACWADDIGSDGLRVMQEWHFINMPYNPQNVEIKKDPVTDDNVVTVIESLLKTLRKKNLPPYILSFAIANLLHFFGDIHQPLHSIELFSPAYPDGELGGNKQVVYVNGKKTNLHAVWDSICQGDQLDFPRPLSEANYATLIELVDYLEDTYKFEDSQKSETNVSAMAEESYNVGLDVAYPGVENGKPLTDEYLQKCKLAAEPRVALAGYRLATALNQILAFQGAERSQTVSDRDESAFLPTSTLGLILAACVTTVLIAV